MRFIALVSSVLFMSVAQAQTPPADQGAPRPEAAAPPTPVVIPAPPPHTATPMRATAIESLPDEAAFPRDIERGGRIAPFHLVTEPRLRFNDAAPSETPLEHMRLDGAGDIYCGSAASSAAAAAEPTGDTKLGTLCFADSNNDGAADLQYTVLNTTAERYDLEEPSPLPAPRAWTRAPDDRRLAFIYSGPVSGLILSDGRLGLSVIEVAIVDEGESRRAFRPQQYPCLEDGRCYPLFAGGDRFVLMSNPTVDGQVHLQVGTRAEAEALVASISAAIEQRRAEMEARNAAAKGADDTSEQTQPTPATPATP